MYVGNHIVSAINNRLLQQGLGTPDSPVRPAAAQRCLVTPSSEPDGSTRFCWLKAPTSDELTQLTHTIAHRVARYLERQGLLESDTGNINLTPEAMDASDEDPTNQLLGSSITCTLLTTVIS